MSKRESRLDLCCDCGRNNVDCYDCDECGDAFCKECFDTLQNDLAQCVDCASKVDLRGE